MRNPKKKIALRFQQVMEDITKVEKIISKKIGQDFSITNHDLGMGWIEEFFNRELTKEQYKFLIDTLKKYFGELDRPSFSQVYKKVQKERYDNFKFFTYLKEIK